MRIFKIEEKKKSKTECALDCVIPCKGVQGRGMCKCQAGLEQWETERGGEGDHSLTALKYLSIFKLFWYLKYTFRY